MRWSLASFSWFIAVLNGSGIAILKLLGMPQVGHRHIHSPEEIQFLIAESRDGGLLEPDEHRRLRRALRLAMRPAKQLMVPRSHISAIDVDTPIEEVFERVANSPYTRFPVYRRSIDNIIGILHTKDLVTSYFALGSVTSIEGLVRPIPVIPENVTADRTLNFLRENRTHQAIVGDEFGGVAGLVTLEDVLAEILGEVGDEFKAGQPQPERLPDGRVRVPGLMRLDEAERWIGTLWQGETHTVSGRVIESLSDIPAAGERVTIDGVEVEVEKVENHAIASILAKPVPPAEEEHGG